MSRDRESRERHLRKLFREQDGKCRVCGCIAYLDGDRNNPLAAVRFRTGSKYGAPGRVRLRVMAHRKCAQERSDQITASQPLDELRHRAKRWGDVYEAVALSSTESKSP